jgi:hypothetical protein
MFSRSNEYDANALIKIFSTSVAKSTGKPRQIVNQYQPAGADYVALIVPYQGSLVIEAT